MQTVKHGFGARAVMLCATGAMWLASGCGDGKHGSGEPPVPPGETDISSNGVVSLDESGLVGTSADGHVSLRIPIEALAGDDNAKGTLDVELRSVDGSTILSSVKVEYDLEPGAHKTLRAELDMPEGATDEADLASFNVRVAQKSKVPLRVTRSLQYVLPIYEVKLEGPAQLRADKQVAYRALVQDPRTRQPISDKRVELSLQKDGDAPELLHTTTDETGSAVFEVALQEAGDYALSASTENQGTSVELNESVAVQAQGQKVLLTTDKPIYQPGQTIHLRALALESPSNRPLADQDIVLEVEDGKGNKIMKRTRTTDDHGIASARFAIANIVNMGTFKVRAISGGAGGGTAGAVVGEKTVEVSRYVLPKFDVDLAVDKTFYAPGETIQGTLNARYFFGRDTAGASVTIEALTLDVAENVFQRVMGVTDANGEMSFELELPDTLAGIPLQDGNALVTLRATVTDTAEQEVRQEKALTVASALVRLALVPESTTLVPGIENRFHLFATDPIGAPIAGASVEATPNAAPMVAGETDPFGHVELRWTPTSAATEVVVKLSGEDQPEVSETFTFGTQAGGNNVLVRTDKSIYQIGETVTVDVLTAADESVAYVDWLNEGQAVDMRTLEVEGSKARFTMSVDTNMLGDNRIEAYVVDDQGIIIRAGRSIVVKGDSGLSVSLDTDKTSYTPGEPAELTFSVVDDQGEPAAAALGVQIVDEAVFSLIDARPGLLKTFFELEDAFAEPQYEIKGPIASFEQLLFVDTAPGTDEDAQAAAQTRAEGSLAALSGRGMMGLQTNSWPLTVAASNSLIAPLLTDEQARVKPALEALVKGELATLVAAGCSLDEYWCEASSTSLSQAVLQALSGRTLDADFWGRPYSMRQSDSGANEVRLISAGPDEQPETADDQTIAIALSALDASAISDHTADAGIAFDNGGEFAGGAGMFAQAPGAGGAGGAGGTGAFPVTDNDDGTSGDPGTDGSPRVRREFPETLYVNPSIITDSDGKATISIDMADSITEWRVSALANSLDGKLGGGQSGITVFQDFFVDVSFPAELTRGDEVELPIVVYNYLTEAQSVRLELEAADWYTALGATEITLDLTPGQVLSTHFPVRVDTVGTQTLTVRAFGSDASDAVARMVRVVPDGQAVPLAQSGSLADGSSSLNASFPIDAVPGSQQLYLDVFPAFLSQAVAGLDSMLMEPSGCFEQTTSTTWPNVLVTRYMQETGQVTPEIQLKAETFISAGYQRLLTFEHPGGGFSWFGTQDPAPFLSVTAFGLMEFADMAGVSEVDPAMIERTQSWLLSQQQADGSWVGDQTEFFSFQTSALRNTAFTAWAIGQNGYAGAEMERALDYLKANLPSTETDAYTLALVANAFVYAAPDDSFTQTLLERLDELKTVSGEKISWNSGDTQTDFYSGGDDAAIAATALVTHALLTAGGFSDTVGGALNFLTGSKDSVGNFGSTQSTVWTLKTLLLAALKGTSGAVGTLTVSLDGTEFASVELTEDQADVMTRVDMSPLATTGAHTVAVAFNGTGKVSYGLVSQHHVPWALAQPTDGPLAITMSYDRTSLAVDETVSATVSITNQSGGAQNMLLVTVGIPPGFDLLTEDLDQLVQSAAISHYEKTGKQLILYITSLTTGEMRALTYRLRANMPVRAVDGGAQARLYYEPEKQAAAAATLITATAL